MYKRQHLDGAYTVFGEVLEGMDIVDKIQKVKTDRNDRHILSPDQGFLSVHFRFFLRLDFVLILFLCAAGFQPQIILMKPVLKFFFFLQFFLLLRC